MRVNIPKPTWERCVICGEYVSAGGELVGGKVKSGGAKYAHRSCWEREQDELKRRAEPCKHSKKK